MKVLELLDKLQDLVENGATVPFSTKIIVDPDEVLDLLDEIRAEMPGDLKDAIRINEQEKMIIGNAEREANKIMNAAERKVKELIDSDEITRSAYNKAEDMLKKANTESLNMRIGSIEYSAAMLKDLQDKLRDMINVVEDNKVELKELRKSATNSRPPEVREEK
ncbi:hypothetical protein [Anaerofustis stercorihominis]|uniref:ATPase n=2 Tax=Anaerofustis stercorihominis TaxID=214853 RepID=B1C9D3_9FIRM|nr:hypothetical protein [Anaerofustis stercorihominis]EDS72297.1 hypothetical protein ANASTE_02008 [Anaerofustis stercorihominis DSM 17244]MCQ4795105.1 hypothetical protein [Anaerofustis stercorihominis]RGD73162.1 hypothetical protein DW687_10485 [Anaerofustis stercorihominis]